MTTDGAVHCWGSDAYGQAGTGDVTAGPVNVTHAAPRRAAADVPFARVSVGPDYTCALGTAGAAYCWGLNRLQVVGLPTTGASSLGGPSTDRVVPRPQAVSGGLTFTAVSAGDAHACGLATDGAPWCWGDNTTGQLGDGRAVGACAGGSDTACYRYALTPRRVASGVAFRDVVAGDLSTCALDAAGGLWCWGLVGLGAVEQPFAGLVGGPVSRAPVRIPQAPALARIVEQPYGDVQYPWLPCGQDDAGALLCFANSGGGAAVRAVLPSYRFRQVTLVGRPAAGAMGCGVASDGVAYCWTPTLDGAGRPPGQPVPVAGQR